MPFILQNLTYCPSEGGIDSYFYNLAKNNPDESFTVVAFRSDVPTNRSLANVSVLDIARTFRLPRVVQSALLRLDLALLVLFYLHDRLRVGNRDSTRICRHPLFLLADMARPTVFLMATALPVYFDAISRRRGGLVRGLLVPIRKALLASIEGQLIRRASVAVLSERVKREVAQTYDLANVDILVNPPGVDHVRFSFKARTLDGPINLVSVCRLSPEKNLPLVLRALAHASPRFTLSIVGDGPERSDLEAQAKSLGISQRVRFHGFQEDVVPFLHDAHVFVMPSTYEGFGHVYLEAMSTGLPCVALAVAPGINVASAEVIEDGANGILIRNDVDACLAAITAIASSPEVYDKMSRAARATALMYRWSSHLRRLELYRRGLGE
jgi:glycosyltransferase involved in cell wall biosynthesis